MGALKFSELHLSHLHVQQIHSRSFQRKKFLVSFVFLQKKLAVRAPALRNAFDFEFQIGKKRFIREVARPITLLSLIQIKGTHQHSNSPHRLNSTKSYSPKLNQPSGHHFLQHNSPVRKILCYRLDLPSYGNN
jgi:hypothetical protein